MEDVFVGRQPIYDRELKVFAYELLYRHADCDRAVFGDGEDATSAMLANTFLDIGLEQVVGSLPAFLNFSRGFLTGERAVPMAPEQVVIEILEDVEPDAAVIAGVRQLAEQGYRFALDDFIGGDLSHPLFAFARMVKLEVNGVESALLAKQVKQAKALGLQVVAEKVETQEAFSRCKALGFDYFQGFFLCRPQVVKGRRLPRNTFVTLQLLARLQDPEATAEDIEAILIQDLSLSYALLRYINCATYALRREVESVRHAILLLGTRAIRNWATLLVLRSSAASKPPELMTIALTRARMCEALSRELAYDFPEQAFTVGLLSVLDAVMDAPMEELLDAVPLSSPIKLALVDREGPYGELLEQVLDYERGRWERFDSTSLKPSVVTETYLGAIQWASEQQQAFAV